MTYAAPGGQARKGPTSLMEMELNLSDMYVLFFMYLVSESNASANR